MDEGDDDDLELGPEVADALAKGTDLRQYSAEIETALRSVERASIQDYLQESESLAGLHTQACWLGIRVERRSGLTTPRRLFAARVQIRQCDGVLDGSLARHRVARVPE